MAFPKWPARPHFSLWHEQRCTGWDGNERPLDGREFLQKLAPIAPSFPLLKGCFPMGVFAPFSVENPFLTVPINPPC